MDSNHSINVDETLEPENKKLKTCQDLKITVGGAVDGSGAIDYWYYASIMVKHSNYIDTMLAIGMKERNAYEISFPDIAPATWESMMKFLDKPLAARLMTVKDVLKVAPGYEQYDFAAGRELSGHILTEYIQGNVGVPDDLDLFIDAIRLADTLHLDEAKDAGVVWIEATILFFDLTIFSRVQIAKLAPLLANEDSLFAIVKKFVETVATKDDILHRLFPELLVNKFALYQKSRRTGEEWSRRVQLTGSGCDADGIYITLGSFGGCAVRFFCVSLGLWGGQKVHFDIMRSDDIWVILGRSYTASVETILWKCPHSRNLMVPPKVGWVAVDELAIGKNPTLKYLMQA
jgi:hypothetical protein